MDAASATYEGRLMDGMRRLNRSDLHVGTPLQWSCYDRNGHLLLRKGVAISFDHQIDRLIGEGLFAMDSGGSTKAAGVFQSESVFERLVSLTWGLRASFNDLLSNTPSSDTEERLRSRVQKVMEVCVADPNAAIAAIHLDVQNPYVLSHHVHSAIMCVLLGKRIGISDEDLLPVVCAAMTCDLGMAEFVYLEKQTASLDEEQAATVRQHVERSVSILARAGIDDPIWLNTILQHHERWNGTGYPNNLAREEIAVGARLLAVADSYTAMVRTRAHRLARMPLEAQGEIFKHMGILYEARICVALVKEFGLYPPGSMVRLTNSELVVSHRRIDGKSGTRSGEW